MSTARIDSDSVHTEHLLFMFPTIQENTTGNITYTAENFTHTLVIRNVNGAIRTDTTPTAAQIITHMKNINSASQTNSSINTMIRNSGTYDLTINTGTGVTSYGDMTIKPDKIAIFLLRIQNDTPSSENVEIYRINTTFNIPTISERAVADIINGTFYNPSTSTTLWSDKTPIIFEQQYIYLLDGSDPVPAENGPADNTDQSITNTLNVLMKMNSGFFINNGDTLRFSINWRDYADGRLNIQFTNANTYTGGSRQDITFASLLINTNATNGYTMNWVGYKNNNSAVNLVTTSLVPATDPLFAISSTNYAQPVILEIFRINNTQLTARLYDYQMNTIAGQADLTCNSPTSTFNNNDISISGIDTNNDGIFVNNIDHVTISEISSSAIDLKIQHNP